MAMVKKTSTKKSTGRRFQTVIASPPIRRCPTSPVVIQGWLSKRGTKGLMLWKERWCVLSDYCLFYYKDIEQQKLIGSFLVASYKISVCGPDDKINKSFSFKAEHNNMKTYYFSADNLTAMANWVKALTLASLVQEVPRNEDEKLFKSQNDGLLNKRNNTNSSCSESIISAFQPVYVNAPPKPRRLNEPFADDMQELQGAVMPHEHLYDVKMRPSTSASNQGPIPIARPRSADILDLKDSTRNDEFLIQSRPKSSLRLTPPQSIFSFEPWSEQDYAEKMRRSAMYVAPKLQQIRSPSAVPSAVRFHHPRHFLVHSQPTQQPPKSKDDFDKLFQRSASARLSCVQEENTDKCGVNSMISSQNKSIATNDFIKSQQREESMKRLLEWKQRMLHSPLTQKTDRTAHADSNSLRLDLSSNEQSLVPRDSPLNQLYWKNDVFLANEINNYKQSNIDRQIQLGKSIKRVKSVSRLTGHDQASHTCNSSGDYNWDSNNVCLHMSASMDNCQNKLEKETVSTGNPKIYHKLSHSLPVGEASSIGANDISHDVRFSSHPSSPSVGDFLKLDETEVIKEFSYHYIKSDENAEKKDIIEVGSHSSGQSTNHGNSAQIPEISFTCADYKKISSDSERDEEVAAVLSQNVIVTEPTSPRDLTPKNEENYMPMSPRKKDSIDNCCQMETLQAISPGRDESPYVEMTQKEGSSRNNENKNNSITPSEKISNQDQKVHFEVRQETSTENSGHHSVTIKGQCNNNAEPLYMEVRDNSNDRHTLPDILNSAGSFNHGRQASFSSDADDEASKDLDSSDLRPRFSLSDTFRPASYYLGGNGCEGTLVPVDSDQQDSSDSDLVWPPPIPANSPPLENLDTSIDSINKSPLPFMNLTMGQRSVTPTSDEESVKWRRKTLKRRPLSADILNNLNELGTEYTKCDSPTRVFSESQRSCDVEVAENQVLDDHVRKDGNAPYYYSDLLKASQQREDCLQQRQGRWRSLEGLVDGGDETERNHGNSHDLWATSEQSSICWADRPQNTDRRTRSLEELDRQPQDDHVLPLIINSSHSHADSIDRTSEKGNTKTSNESTSHETVNEDISQPVSDQKEKHNWNLKLSAGELLGRTHEELVLLLIQLRRQRARICKSMEGCHREIEAQQACLSDLDPTHRLDHLQRLEELKTHLGELEKQYEKGKPLVNLVDNMVKLGSLYQGGGGRPVPTSKLEFNHKVEEQRLLAEERRDWERIHPDHHDLQAKVEQLYRLDKLLQEESGTLHSLQEDKGLLERALGGLKNKLQTVHGNSAETEWYRRQQRLLEKELTRVRSILALNSKKLEETVAENARLEQELVVLRQKLQVSRRSGSGADGVCTSIGMAGGTAALESELWRVQVLVGNLLRQRHELSLQVSQLTDKSNSLSQQMYPTTPPSISPHLPYPNDSASNSKKTTNNMWVETDLDNEKVVTSPVPAVSPRQHPLYISPLYVNTEAIHQQETFGETGSYPEDYIEDTSSPLARSPELYKNFETEEDNVKRSHGLSWKDRPQEIKTVRIVKRESERRQRDRDRSGNLGIPIGSTTAVKKPISTDLNQSSINEKFSSDRVVGNLENIGNLNEINEPPPPAPRSDSVNTVRNIVKKNRLKGNLLYGGSSTLTQEGIPNSSTVSGISPQLSPVYLSETARKIVEEVAWQGRKTGSSERRLIPREKRRHHTVSGPSISTQHYVYNQCSSRDDLDMERVLRPRLTTPDVVKSTLHRPDTFTNETIDRLLGAPGKILIPERYIPEIDDQPPSVEERARRSRKATAIRKMLTETTTVTHQDLDEDEEKCIPLKDKVEEEKRNREHLLQLSQILAQEVMEKSKIVAGVSSTYNKDKL